MGLPEIRYWIKFRSFLRRSYCTINDRNERVASLLKIAIFPFVRFIERYLFGLSHKSLLIGSYSGSNSKDVIARYQSHDADSDFTPLVTIIVPNYNHDGYLRRRLDSIYNQTYQNYEVILLDDCSTDESFKILNEYYCLHSEKTTLVVNQNNSGGVFFQWQKGFSLANGDIIWIAESDDFCTDNFLEKLVPYFKNEAITLAYSRTTFVRGDKETPFWTIEEYLSDISPVRWSSSFVESAHQIVAEAFSIKNIIPNVSSAIFRHPGNLEILHDPLWQKMRTCGDWVLYLHMIRGGLLAYEPSATNYYRIHGNNTSVKSYSDDDFYKEHEVVAQTVQRYFKVNLDVYNKQQQNLIMHWKQTREDYSDSKFTSCYSVERICNTTSERSINLLMVGYAFCAGGGETFPILLSNLMKGSGYNVTFFDCRQEPRLSDIRKSLRSDIPVVSDLAHLESIVSDFGIDVIHSHHAWVDNTVVDVLSSDNTVKTVVTLHGMYETISDTDLKRLLPRLVKRTAKFVYTAEKNLTALRTHGYDSSKDMSRIDNALELYDFDSMKRAELGVPDEAFLLTVVSRAIPEKGWREAIAAVKYARDEYNKDIHLLLIGEGPVYTELVSEGVPEFIHLVGFKKNIRSYFSASDLGFLPSRFEGESFPLVIIDCLHAGVPVLASAIGEIPYMLKTGNGLAGMVFELDNWDINVVQLGNIIGLLSEDKDKVNKMRECVEQAAHKFDPYTLAENYNYVYQAALTVTSET